MDSRFCQCPLVDDSFACQKLFSKRRANKKQGGPRHDRSEELFLRHMAGVQTCDDDCTSAREKLCSRRLMVSYYDRLLPFLEHRSVTMSNGFWSHHVPCARQATIHKSIQVYVQVTLPPCGELHAEPIGDWFRV